MSRTPVDGLLLKCDLGEYTSVFKEMGIVRVVALRSLPADVLERAVPDPEKREILLNAIRTRGDVGDASRQHRNPDDPTRGAHDDGRDMSRGGRGGGRGRGRGRGEAWGGEERGGRGGGRGRGEGRGRMQSSDPCRNYFHGNTCTYGDNCRYSHDERLRAVAMEQEMNGPRGGAPQPEPIDLSEYIHELDIEIPTDRIKFLFGHGTLNLRAIQNDCQVVADKVDYVEDTTTTVVKFHGKTEESLIKARQLVEISVGIRKDEQKRERFEYAANELDTNIHAVSLLAACNTKNAGTDRHLPDSILRRVISTFRFIKPQDVRHYYIACGSSDKEKMEKLSAIISQLKGVQAILFCEAKRVEEMSKAPGVGRISRTFNGVTPQFMYRTMTKQARLEALEAFKNGESNEAGVKQRLLVTNEDYAKLARKTVIPYVNLVINFSVPRTEEFYLLQALTAGRHGTVGASFLCVSSTQEDNFRQLRNAVGDRVEFEEFVNEETFRLTAMELQYDTPATPLTPENAEPPADWREHLHDEKPKRVNHAKGDGTGAGNAGRGRGGGGQRGGRQQQQQQRQ